MAVDSQQYLIAICNYVWIAVSSWLADQQDLPHYTYNDVIRVERSKHITIIYSPRRLCNCVHTCMTNDNNRILGSQ